MKRTTVIAIVAASAVLVVALAALAWNLARPGSADDAAERYLRALAAGDADAMRSLLPQDAPADTLLATFAAADAYVQEPEITDSEPDGEVRTYRASVRLQGDATTIRFALTDDSGSWTLTDDSLAVIETTTTLGEAVAIGETVLSLRTDGAQGADGALTLLPAVYTAQAAPTDFLDGDATFAAITDHSAPVFIDALLAPDAATRAQPQLDAYLDGCAQATTEVPPRCGLAIPWAADLVELTGLNLRIEAYPALSIDPATLSFIATDGVVVATAVGVDQGGATVSATYRTDAWTVRGALTFTEGQALLTVF
ncbi:hypothetical protein QNO21_08590 [Microbacterium sp. zg-Y818]|uniref:hypothetical protein n=1 Tax=unclassified Microbacterium TaxID=2609290 RepID=UPI00214AD3E2|nr:MULTISPECIES: hypothetical protein [unclassified Microbacterium]MCR2801362.1 hypothetical protein [Microbacterium sp. zg.Y818]WIM21189.1 hypothetical protein QNO21_08590 [Microbacterium sp. zg-Y818]